MDYKNLISNYGEIAGINHWAKACHASSVEAGWWDAPAGFDSQSCEATWLDLVTPTKLCLVHSEVSEAMEGFRKNLQDDHLPHRSMLEVELADAMIRILDLAGAHNLDLAGAMVEKMRYNWKRADHKPEARAADNGKKF